MYLRISRVKRIRHKIHGLSESEKLAFKNLVLARMSEFDHHCMLDSCSLDSAHGIQEYDWIAAYNAESDLRIEIEQKNLDPLAQLQDYHESCQDWIFGVISYDLKNSLHKQLSSDNQKFINTPIIDFFQPRTLVYSRENALFIESYGDPNEEYDTILSAASTELSADLNDIEINQGTSKEEYLKTIGRIKDEIRKGNVYEVNYCVNYSADYAQNLSSVALFKELSGISPAPFSALYHSNEKALISASPERYLKHEEGKLISQPIKGTRPRGANTDEDLALKIELQNSLKERAENVMIVDLVRNDLAHTCEPGSVQVKELFGIYSYKQVHQMVSTIEGEMKENHSWTDAIRHSFPMGSMTGAPKIAAMTLIDEIEDFQRGWYSGSLGYVKPNGDFDFNVVIRSLVQDTAANRLCFSVGGAITYDSSAEEEWNECELKAKAIKGLLTSSNEVQEA